MSNVKLIQNKNYEGERPLFALSNAKLENVTFGLGESALKEAKDVIVENSEFINKYVLWHVQRAYVINSIFHPESRSSIWYSHNIKFENVKVLAPKIFRDSTNITLNKSELVTNEAFWDVSDVEINNSKLEGEYSFLHSKNIKISNTIINGNYSFQHSQNIELNNVEIHAKDALWNCENVKVYDSVIYGEYIGWYSKKMRFVNCKFIGTQPLCYIDNLSLENCQFENADLCFENSTINATIHGKVGSIRNPQAGKIIIDKVGELIMNNENSRAVQIEIRNGDEQAV